MRKVFDETFIFIFFVLPFLVIYAKFFDYYNVTVVEPKVGMKCGDGTPKETWVNGETILIPTYDCTTLDHYLGYAEWFAKAVPAYLAEHSEFFKAVKDYFMKVMDLMVGMFMEIFTFLKDL